MAKIRASDLDDFITPGPVCIKPIEYVRPNPKEQVGGREPRGAG
jgi:hypothetical protein